MKMNNLEFNDPKYKLIALYYGISAIIGLGLITYQLFTNPFHILVFILYVLIYIQLVFMLFGALQYWDKRQTGLKILFWISLSLIPAFYTPLIAYIPKITSGLFIYFETGFGANGAGFDVFVFYNTTLRIFNEQFWRIGINLIEFFIFLRFLNLAKAQNISLSSFRR